MRKMPAYSAQEIFDTVAKHLLTLKEPCGVFDYKENFHCLYRDGQGGKCAIGALIPDELYQDDFDSGFKYDDDTSIINLMANDADGIFDNWHIHRSLLCDLQAAHDFEPNWDHHRQGLGEALMDIARKFKLDDGVLRA